MSRFIAPDLARLPKLPLVEPDHQSILDQRMAAFATKAEAVGLTYDVDALDSDPVKIDQILGADREVGMKAELNDQVRAVMLASSWGAYLDHIAATYYGISRLQIGVDEETGDPVMEKDPAFKNRIALAPEAFSTAGPEGAYVFHALELDGAGDVADAAAYSEEDGAVYDTDAPVLAPEILVVVLPRLGYAGTGPALIDRVYAAVTASEVRPLGDKVTVELADEAGYQVEATIRIAPGADPEPIAVEARKQVEAYVAARRRIGATVQRLGLGGALRVTDVTEIELTAPAADIDRGSKGAATCTDITITVEEGADTWRAIP